MSDGMDEDGGGLPAELIGDQRPPQEIVKAGELYATS